MKRLSIIIILLTVSLVSNAQQKQGQALVDSLLGELPKTGEDLKAVKLLNKIAFEYANINPDEGLKYAERELALAQKLGVKSAEGLAYNDLGLNFQSKGNYPAALDAFFKSLSIDESLGDKVFSGRVYSNIGNVYEHQKDYNKSLEYHFKALKMAEGKGDKQRMMAALGNIGNVYDEQGKHTEALDYDKRSLKLAEELNDEGAIALNTGNIGNIYTNLEQYPNALKYDFKALRLAQEIGDKQSIAVNFGNIGENYYNIAKGGSNIRPDSLVPAGKEANLARSVEYLKKGIAACREIQLLDAIPEFSQYLSNALALKGDYKGALEAYQQYKAVKDSLYNIANNEKITNLETKRAVELKDKDIQIAKLEVARKRDERVYFIAGIALLLVIMGIIFRSYRRQQRSNQLLSVEKKRSDDLLLNILPTEVAEELKQTGMAHAQQYDEVSVLFTDFVDFTGTAEKLSAQQIVRELHECFSAFDAIIVRNGLEKIKTIGDAYLAVSGLPAADPEHAKKTVRAALEIRDFIEHRKEAERVFEIRIGINSGPVVAGIVGVKKFAYDIWGDTVNTACRMQEHGVARKINISRSTYDLVKDEFECTYRGKVAAKNKGEVDMYFVEAMVGEKVLIEEGMVTTALQAS